MEKTIEELEQELQELKENNKAAWDMYGSELCSGEMCAKEDTLKKKIEKLKVLKKWRKANIVDENDKPIPAIPRQILRLKDDLFPSLKDSEKKITIRRGYRNIRIGILLFKGIKDQNLQYEVEVVEVRHLRISGVSDGIAREDGFKDWVYFYQEMKKYYPDLDVSEECTLIYFE